MVHSRTTFPAPFDQEFFLILNLAVGGWFGGDPDETTPFPTQMVVDYVRVYEEVEAEAQQPEEFVEESVESESSNSETNLFNLLLVGLVAIVLASITFIVKRRK